MTKEWLPKDLEKLVPYGLCLAFPHSASRVPYHSLFPGPLQPQLCPGRRRQVRLSPARARQPPSLGPPHQERRRHQGLQSRFQSGPAKDEEQDGTLQL